jgi:hypothetical protein
VYEFGNATKHNMEVDLLTTPADSPNPGPTPIRETDIDNAINIYLQQAATLRQRFFNAPAGAFQEENLMFNGFGQDPFLLISQFRLHELSMQIQRRLPIYLTKQFKIQVELDSKWFWALTKDVSSSSQVVNNWYLSSAFNTLFAAQLASAYYLSRSSLAEKLNRILTEALPRPSFDLLTRGRSDILMYLCYPVLEGMLKLILRSYVDENGNVLSAIGDGTTSYTTNSRSISSLSVYLHALETSAGSLISKPELETDLRDFRRLIETDFASPIAIFASSRASTVDGWEWIYSLRNVSLHGAIGWQLRSALITNLICMLTWHILEPSEISSATTAITQTLTRPYMMRFGMNYYPPVD